MQKEDPDYVAATKAFELALKDRKYDLREESLANQGWCLYASAGEGEQRDCGQAEAGDGIISNLGERSFPKVTFSIARCFTAAKRLTG